MSTYFVLSSVILWAPTNVNPVVVSDDKFDDLEAPLDSELGGSTVNG